MFHLCCMNRLYEMKRLLVTLSVCSREINIEPSLIILTRGEQRWVQSNFVSEGKSFWKSENSTKAANNSLQLFRTSVRPLRFSYGSQWARHGTKLWSFWVDMVEIELSVVFNTLTPSLSGIGSHFIHFRLEIWRQKNIHSTIEIIRRKSHCLDLRYAHFTRAK